MGGGVVKSRLAPGRSGGGLARPRRRSGCYSDGGGRTTRIQSKGEGLEREKRGLSGFLCGPSVSDAYMAAVRRSANLLQLCFKFMGIRTVKPIHEPLMYDIG